MATELPIIVTVAPSTPISSTVGTENITSTVSSTAISSTVGPTSMTATVSSTTIAITLGTTVTRLTFINVDEKLFLNGQDGNTYFTYNSSLSRLELYVNGTIRRAWN